MKYEGTNLAARARRPLKAGVLQRPRPLSQHSKSAASERVIGVWQHLEGAGGGLKEGKQDSVITWSAKPCAEGLWTGWGVPAITNHAAPWRPGVSMQLTRSPVGVRVPQAAKERSSDGGIWQTRGSQSVWWGWGSPDLSLIDSRCFVGERSSGFEPRSPRRKL